MEFRNILVRATNWVGDAVMSVPALQALRDRFPHARITILAMPWVGAIYSAEPFCDEIVPYDVPRGWTTLPAKLALAGELQKKQFDCAILFPNSFESAAVVWAARIPVRIGYARDGRSVLLTQVVARPERGQIPPHQRFYYLELLRRARLIEAYRSDGIRLSAVEKHREKGRLRFTEAGLKNSVIGVGPGAAYGGAKRWLPERFAEAASELAQEQEASVAIFGSKDEAAIGEEVRKGIEKRGVTAVNFAGATTLTEFIEMAAACDTFLTNDSGPMHIASALGVPTVAIFGATDDEATGPTGDNSRVVREPVECSPCLLRECPIDHRCMTRVAASQVTSAARSLGVMKH